ncbi:hypothetical protein vBEliSR6L_4 [Erythrobacter phage vB_EliS_R6L]|nr:hypothetical protein vBEliSR6L_4 [Erythrobacter phage vB_EliS_R6L]
MKIIRPKAPDPGFPCKRCGVRPDVDCDHRPADPFWTMGPEPPDEDNRRRSGSRWSL